MSFIPTITLIVGEALMSFYPILVKNIKANIFYQTFLRLITTTIVCYPFISTTISHVVCQSSYHIISMLYLTHIFSSYLGFKNLEVGVALTLFYLYPLINVLIRNFLIKISQFYVIPYFFMSLVGVFIINRGDKVPQFPHSLVGVTAMIFSAVTESLIYTFYKSDEDQNPFNMLFSLCLTGSFILIMIFVYKWLTYAKPTQSVVDSNFPPIHIILIIVICNIFFGVIGYLFRFYSMHQMTTEWFSILSFSGIIFGYLYGWFFYGEKINMFKLIGTLLIILSAYKVKSLGY